MTALDTEAYSAINGCLLIGYRERSKLKSDSDMPTHATKYRYTVSRSELRRLQAVEPVSDRLRAIGALWNEAHENPEARWETVIVIVDEHGKEWGACYPREGE